MVRVIAAIGLILAAWATAGIAWDEADGRSANSLVSPTAVHARDLALAAPEPREVQDAGTEDDDEPDESDEPEAKDEQDADKQKSKSDDDEPAAKDADKNRSSDDDDEPSEADSDAEAEKKAAADAKSTSGKKSADKSNAGDEDADEEDAKPAKKEQRKPDTHKVATKDLKIEVEIDGVFVAEEMQEVALRPKVWSSFKVKEAVKHGERVRKGDVLVKFDDEDIEDALAEKALEERLGELALMEAEEDFPRHEKSTELEYQLAKRSYEQDLEEFERFQKVMRELSEKLANYYLKSAQQELDNAREELEQLEKMYEADELTEETEEIVLKRQKFQVEMAQFNVEYSKINHDYTLNVSIPRREERLSTAVDQGKLSFDRAKMNKSLGLSRERYELEGLRERRARAVERHAELMSDRALMTLRSPADGIAYYGRQINGRWIEVGSMENKLVPFGSVSPNSVVFTVVSDRPMYVETFVSEKEFPTVKAGQAAVVTPMADNQVELAGRVKSVSDVPGSGNKFTVRLSLKDESDAPEWLKPGMSCSASVTTYEADDAVTIPADLVQTDKDDEKQKYVMLQLEDEDKPVRRDIELGKKKDKDVEVLEGLEKGDLIVKGAKDKSEDEKNDDESSD